MAQRVIFSDEARADIRAIERDTAPRLLKTLARFLETDAGDVKQLQGFDPPQYRFRIGAWRVIFRRIGAETVEIVRVRNRREAYRRAAAGLIPNKHRTDNEHDAEFAPVHVTFTEPS